MAVAEASENGTANPFTIIHRRRFAMLAGLASTRRRAMAALASSLALLLAAPAAADMFTVAPVAVDETAETAAAARDVALTKGQQRALRRLLERLTLKVDHGRLPSLDAGAVAELVSGIGIDEEKSSATRYIASLSVAFKKDEMRRLLRGHGIPFSEARSKPLLVLPVLRAAGAVRLWQSPNPWREAWSNVRTGADAPVPLIVPAGELADIAALGAEQALAGDARPLTAIAGRYGVADVLVAFAEIDVDLATRVRRLQVSLRRHGLTGPSAVVESFSSTEGESEAALIERVAAAIAGGIQERWKAETLIRFDRERSLSAVVPLRGLRDWLVVRQRLGGNSLVRRVELTALSVEGARIVLHYWGDVARLTVALAQSDLRLVEDAAGFWKVARSDGS